MPDELHRVEMKGNLKGQYRENVFHMKITGATNDTPFFNSNDLVNFLHTNIEPLWLDCLPPDYFLDSILVRRLAPTSGQYALSDNQPQTAAGTRGSGAVSEQLCPCITLIPPMDVKSAGRIFMPAVDKEDIDLNVFSTGYQTAIAALINALKAGGSVAGGTATLVIYSRKLNISSAVSTFHLSTVLGYQRRRARPVGS